MLGEAHTPMVNSALTASWKKVELSSSLLQQPLRLLQAEEECQSLSPTSCLRNAMSSHLANVTWHHKLQSGNRWFNPLRYISWRKSTPCTISTPWHYCHNWHAPLTTTYTQCCSKRSIFRSTWIAQLLWKLKDLWWGVRPIGMSKIVRQIISKAILSVNNPVGCQSTSALCWLDAERYQRKSFQDTTYVHVFAYS